MNLDQKVIDRKTIQGLLNLVEDGPAGKEFLKKLISTFEDVGNSTLSDLKKAEVEGNQHHLSRLGHRLKGSSQTIGALRLATLCEKLELGAVSDQTLNLEELVNAIAAGYQEARCELAKL